MQAEFFDPAAINATVNRFVKVGSLDIVLIAHRSLPVQTECQDDLQSCHEALEINGLSPILYAEAFAKEMENRTTAPLL